MSDHTFAIFNPLNLPVEDLPYIWGFNNGGSPGFYHAVLISQDGHGMGSHLCSHEGYMGHDLGLFEGTRADRHEGFQKHYPEGYRMGWIPSDQIHTHEGFNKAIELNKELAAKAAAEKEA